MAASITPQEARQAYNRMRQWQTAVREHLQNNAEKVLPRHSWRGGGRAVLRKQKNHP